MEGLPFLPGNSFNDPTKSRYHVSHTLNYKNGFQAPSAYPTTGIGGEAIAPNQLTQSELDELANFQPTLTYGQAKQAPPQNFVPAHVAFDKKVLRYYGYFKETVHESPQEHFRVRDIVLYYYLEDDSIAIVEPVKENSGIPQGKIIKRQRIPKNDVGDHWHWKDINLGMNFAAYGRVYRITKCDPFTAKFLESEGIDVNQTEGAPNDPYLTKRTEAASLRTYKTPNAFDKLKQFIELDRKVLRFFTVWDDRDAMFGEMRPFVLNYYLVDDTMEIRECHQPNDGRDPFPVLIRRGKIPINRHDVNSTFPSVVMELSDHEIKQYFTPKELKIGATLVINGRKFLLYDCDNFTKAWYYQHFGMTEFDPVKVDSQGRELPRMEIPPYNNFGSLEDSLQSCLTLVPQPPKKDYIKMLDNDTKVLRFEAYLDSIRPEDRGRRFIISYRLADDMITIYEPHIRNSGVIGGTYLKRTRVAKPGSTADKPVYYGPQDFAIGAKIEVFGARFVISSADQFVLDYMKEHAHQFPPNTISSIESRLSEPRQTREMIKGGPMKLKREEGDVLRLMSEVKSQLKKMAITDKSRIDEMFLRHNSDRLGYIDLPKLQTMCRRMQLPADEDVLSALIAESGSDGKMNLEEFRKFFES